MAKHVELPIVTYVLELRCDKCTGLLEWDGIVLTSNPPLYRHDCGPCKTNELLEVRTGQLVYRRAPTGEER